VINNFLSVNVPNGKAKFLEPSFLDYKNICKMLVSNDPASIEVCIDQIINTLVKTEGRLNIIDKFLIIISLRNTILGNELNTTINGIQSTMNLSSLLNNNYDDTPIEFEFNSTKLIFESPTMFKSKDLDTFLADCLVNICDKDIKDLTLQEKTELISELDIPITEIYRKILDTFAQRKIIFGNDIKFSIYAHDDTLAFIRNIFYEDLFQLLEFEYTCIRFLNLRSSDFSLYTYPELKIFLNHLAKENKDSKSSEEPSM
tara:strand:- start:1577 stop:2350 length:774 start_codon:yes stop_codon:yes gene_type:complete